VTATCQKVLIIKGGKRVAFETLESLHKQAHDGLSLEEIFIRLTSD